jgi:hypothetical protein
VYAAGSLAIPKAFGLEAATRASSSLRGVPRPGQA